VAHQKAQFSLPGLPCGQKEIINKEKNEIKKTAQNMKEEFIKIWKVSQKRIKQKSWK
jgi:hypothetical protein